MTSALARRIVHRLAVVTSAALVAGGLAACSSSTATDEDDVSAETTVSASSSSLWDSTAVHDISVELSDTDYDAIIAAYLDTGEKEWASATVTIDGTTIENVGIKLVRAEIILGRGSFTESFPLFGFDLGMYEQLFEEKLDLFSEILKEKPVTWAGELRPALKDQGIFPLTEGGRIPTWIGVGGSPESVVRAARYGLPLVLAIIGGDPARFAPYVDLFHRALAQLEKPDLPIAVHSPGFIADTDEQAAEQYWPHHRVMRDRIGAERGWPPSNEGEFRQEITGGSLYLGSPETVARKLANTIQTLGIQRFDLKYSAGTLPHELMMHSIELYGSKVIPMVKDMLA